MILGDERVGFYIEIEKVKDVRIRSLTKQIGANINRQSLTTLYSNKKICHKSKFQTAIR